MFSLQCLSARKIIDHNSIPVKHGYKKCCVTIDEEEAIRNGHLECLKYGLDKNNNEDYEIFMINEIII